MQQSLAVRSFILEDVSSQENLVFSDRELIERRLNKGLLISTFFYGYKDHTPIYIKVISYKDRKIYSLWEQAPNREILILSSLKFVEENKDV